ncbi:MAG: 2'-5' RNA ligase family protein [Alphaproteobacteria bacterium]|nr:2'-5' RNA ligase family protein [Alphaproteobacteria bacterium]MCW5743129.1 2'-5' RNA ligase family protein [Alphaproteobacteria bacterium]
MAVVPFPRARRGDAPAPSAPSSPHTNENQVEAPSRLYVVAEPVLLPEDRARLVNLRAQYHAEANLIGPHFTLVFGVDPDARDALAEAVERVASSVRPFWFVLQRLRVDAPPRSGRAWLYAEPDDGAEELGALHDMLTQSLPKVAGAPAFEPHLTLGMFANGIDAERVAQIAERQTVPMHGRIESLRLVETDRRTLIEIAMHRFRSD